MQSVNIGNIVVKGVHGPNVDGYPLYTPSDGYSGGDKNRTDKWIKMSQGKYNSPTNIKSVIITNKRVITKLYKGVFENGKLARRTLIKAVDNLEEYAMCLCNTEPMMKLEYKATGTGIKALARPWVATNIETLYFDWTSLLDEDVVAMIGLPKIKAILCRQATLSKQEVVNIVSNELKCQIEGLSERYPRFHKIAFCFDLEQFVDQYGNIAPDLPGATVVTIPTARRDKFGMRPGIYKYDDNVLSRYISEITQVGNGSKSDKKSQEDKKTDKTEETDAVEVKRPTKAGEEEKLLMSIYTKAGLEGVKKAIGMCDKSLVDNLTQEGYELYQRALNG